jgi:hypothetical protein
MTAAASYQVAEALDLKADELRDLAEKVIAAGFPEITHAAFILRAMTDPARHVSNGTRLQYVLNGRKALRDLESDSAFYQGAGLELWATPLDLSPAAISAIRRRHESLARPVREGLRAELAKLGQSHKGEYQGWRRRVNTGSA